MRPIHRLSAAVFILAAVPSHGSAQAAWNADQKEVLASIDRLSEATAPGGGGPEAYDAVLADDFSRWTLGGGVLNTKDTWVEGVREWYGDGWRVADRSAEILEVRVVGDFAFTRRIVEETYEGPDGDRSTSKAALAEVWRKTDRGWLLLRVDIITLDS
ncbi:MAG: nuclear transport factor 2 family protein [Gemmatimonadota bacterium]